MKNDKNKTSNEEIKIESNEKERLKKRKKKALINEIKEYALYIVVCFLAAYIINTIFVINARVPTGSMENTIATGTRLFGNRMSYWFSSPNRGDIAIFYGPDEPDVLYVKRVIGLPGDTIEIVSGVLYINGEVYEEDYLAEEMVGSYGPYVVPDGCYFMMGDNRNHSNDSRFWNATHFVKEDDIIAKAGISYYPKIEILK